MNLFSDANLRSVLLGTMLFGMASGALGCFALLRRRALLGDAIAHAALPGVCLAYLITHTKDIIVFIVGATVSGLAGSFAINAITAKSKIKEDAAIGLVLSVFFGIGILLLTYIQHQPLGNQAGLDKFLFGQAASLVNRDVILFSLLAAMLLVAIFFFYKELKVVAFDSAFAQSIGIRVGLIDGVLILLIVLVVTTGLQSVGVVLMAAMLVTPAAAARQWTDRLSRMLCLAAIFGAGAGVTGTLASAVAPRMPTGPWIVVAITFIFAISILAAPRRGIVARFLQHRANSRRITEENILRTLYRFAEAEARRACPIDEIRRWRHLSVRSCLVHLARLERRGLIVTGEDPDAWRLTITGEEEARRLVRRHRLWELYLSRYLHLDKDHVHIDAEEIEHIITPELERRLEALLHHPHRDPHDQPIPGAR